MRGWELVSSLRQQVGLADGEPAGKEDAERLLDVVEGLSLQEADLSEPYLYIRQDGRGIIRAPRGWSKKIGDHRQLLEEVFHYLQYGYADGAWTQRGLSMMHGREEARMSDLVVLWLCYHANLAGLNDEELAESTGLEMKDIQRFRQVQAGMR